MSSRYCSSFTIVARRAGRVLDGVLAARPAARSSRPSSRPSRRRPGSTCGLLFGRQIMSPREMSISSSSRTVTDIGGKASSTSPSAVSIGGDAGREARRQDHHLVALLEHAAGDLPGVAAVVVPGVRTAGGSRTAPANRTSMRLRSLATWTFSRWCSRLDPSYQGMFADRVTTLSPLSADTGIDGQVRHSSLAAKLRELVADPLEDLLGVVDEVHLVDAQHQVRHLQQRGEERVPAALLDQPLAGVDEDQREVGRRGPGDHVAGVLDVPGGVGDDEVAPRRWRSTGRRRRS